MVAFNTQHFPQACILYIPHFGRYLVELWICKQIMVKWQISLRIFSEISSDGPEKEEGRSQF